MLTIFGQHISLLTSQNISHRTIIINNSLSLTNNRVLSQLISTTITRLRLMNTRTRYTTRRLITGTSTRRQMTNIGCLTRRLSFKANLFQITQAIKRRSTIQIRILSFNRNSNKKRRIRTTTTFNRTIQNRTLSTRIRDNRNMRQLLTFMLTTQFSNMNLLNKRLIMRTRALRLQNILSIFRRLLSNLRHTNNLVNRNITKRSTNTRRTYKARITRRLTNISITRTSSTILNRIIIRTTFNAPITRIQEKVARGMSNGPSTKKLEIFTISTNVTSIQRHLCGSLTVMTQVNRHLLMSNRANNRSSLANHLTRNTM